MNDVIKCILERRSVKAYTAKQVSQEDLKLILDAGIHAPSSKNQQSAKLVVVQNKDVLERLKKLGMEVSKRESNPFYDAPTIVIVFARESDIAPVENASLVIGNMMIAAESLGVGSCWIHCGKGIFGTDEGGALRKELGVPDGYVVVGSCILGEMAGEKPKCPARDESNILFIK